jgi:hypothetical protein
MKKQIYLIFASIIFFSACIKTKENNVGIVDGYAPIYLSQQESKVITSGPPKAIIEGGKISKLGNLIFQVENNKGIHISNIQNPSSPTRVAFISIPLCQELTLKGNYIYTNNVNDLVVINISNPTAVSVTNRIANAFPAISPPYPTQENAYFECADESKGVVIGWELKKLENPKCKR